MHRTLAAALVLFAITLGSDALAQEQRVPAGYHSHDGFFLRFTPGLSVAALAASGGVESSLGGGGVSGGLALGGAIAEDLILCGELSGFGIYEPEFELAGVSSTLRETSWGMEYLGVGLSWYTASNLYLHGGLGLLDMSLSKRSFSGVDSGAGLKLGVGKEWWVGADWGLGLAGQLIVAAFPDEGVSQALTTLGLAFSATYN